MKKIKNQSLIVFLVFLIVIAVNLTENIRLIKFQDFNFHTDIARDFFLMKEVVDNRKPTLIGPHIGGIGGLFHGPAWLYLNLPVFIASKGNPIAQNYFYLGLTIVSEIILFLVAKKIFGTKTAIISLLIYSVKLNDWAGNFFHPFGAIIFSPLFYYFFYRIGKEKSTRVNFLFLGLTSGLLAQFQLGFGLPMAIIAFTKIIFDFFKKEISFKKIGIFLSGLIISLSNFIVFDLRHNFLQTKTILNFFKNLNHGKIKLLAIAQNRVNAIIYSSLGLSSTLWSVLLFLIFLIILFLLSQKSDKKRAYQDFLFIFGSFWVITLINSGDLQGYHYWALLPISITIISSLLQKSFPKLAFFTVLFYLILNINTFAGNFSLLAKKPEDVFFDYSSWRFISRAAQDVFNDNQQNFGYFAYSSDLFSYTPRYAMEYWNQFNDYRAHSFQKKELTYLLICPPPEDKQWLDGAWWAQNQVNIKKSPEKIFNFKNKFRTEKYYLSEKEIKVSADPNLIHSIHFR